ncbi:unnamed protein product [Alopecurus aequalis]
MPAAAVLEDDNLLSKILLRLPPHPSSLPRASAVCKHWRSLASDPAFSRRFRRHHRRNPPLLGWFVKDGNQFRFESTLDAPNRVPEARFPCPIDAGDMRFRSLGCRHGFLLMLHASQGTLQLLVWDPVNGHEHPLAIPPEFKNAVVNGAVLRTALGDIQNFQVVLVSIHLQQRVVARVYSSQTGIWGNLISTPLPPNGSNRYPALIDSSKPAVLVGDFLYILLRGKSSSIIEFDVDMQSLAVIPLPLGLDRSFSHRYSVMRAEGGGTGLLFISESDCRAQLWKRMTDCDGVASWVLGRTIALDNLLSLDLQNHWGITIQGFAEENNVVFLWACGNVFKIQLDSLQFKKYHAFSSCWYPFECVYAAGI